VRKIKITNNMDTQEVIYLDEKKIKKTPEGLVLDKLNLTKMCCRRHMLTHVDIE
jgi:DNA-directed RNA polymerase I, II, and III subunit RPABC5